MANTPYSDHLDEHLADESMGHASPETVAAAMYEQMRRTNELLEAIWAELDMMNTRELERYNFERRH